MWGNQYDRLYGIKARYDPGRLFWVTPGVGADDFSIENGRLCRVQESTEPSQGKGRRPRGGRPRTSASNPLGRAPANDNRNYKAGSGSAYKDFPKTQEEAEKAP
jgi:hypothetical protein